MAVELRLVPHFRVQMHQRTTHAKTNISFHRPSTTFRDIIPNSRWNLLDVQCNDNVRIRPFAVSTNDTSRAPALTSNTLQHTDKEHCGSLKRYFDEFVVREALLDEEYWAAACLRAEAHWESLSYMRHVSAYKSKYAEKEFYALTRRCSRRDGISLKCFCVIAVIRDEINVKRTALNSVVGTLDLSIRQFFQGETYPGEIHRPTNVFASQDPLGAHRYAYVANVCVSKSARRQGLATNMIYLAIDRATSAGIKQLYVHVDVDNKAAQYLYLKTGFKVIRAVSSLRTEEQRLLMSMEL